MSDTSDDDTDREGIFDFLWNTDHELGREMSAEMEQAYKDGKISVSVELQSEKTDTDSERQ